MRGFGDTTWNFTGAWCASSVTSCLDSYINNTGCQFYRFKMIYLQHLSKENDEIISF